ncbi:oxidoreductase [Paramyrothecium foliicola]|nr:oxidoreductase [Paramyrothecium foliicola]
MSSKQSNMPPFTFSTGCNALITGGASGIGLAVARKCIGHGMRVLLADKNRSLLSKAREALGEDAFVCEMDVGKADDWRRLRTSVSDHFDGRIDLLFLNAGIQPSSNWTDLSSFESIFHVNFYGVVHGISTFASTMQQQAGSAIVITGSKQGITNPPGNPAYNASKSAVKAIAEHLSYDLRETQTNVHLLVPGWTFTGLGRSQDEIDGERPAAAWTAEQVANYMGEKMMVGEFYIICPDNEVTEEMDKKRMLWSTQDMTERRPALSRWRSEFRNKFQRWLSD